MCAAKSMTCCVPGCNSKQTEGYSLHFHRFPKKTSKIQLKNGLGIKEIFNRKTLWEAALLGGKLAPKNVVACSQHFRDEDYVAKGVCIVRPKLKRSAVPSKNLPGMTPLLPPKKKSVVSTICCVTGCQSNKQTEPSLQFHAFPSIRQHIVEISHKDGRKVLVRLETAWKKLLNISLPINTHYRVCSKHFTSKDYEGTYVLSRYAIPSKNLPFTSEFKVNLICSRISSNEEPTITEMVKPDPEIETKPDIEFVEVSNNLNELSEIKTESDFDTMEDVSSNLIDTCDSRLLPEIETELDVHMIRENECSSESTLTADEDDLQSGLNNEMLFLVNKHSKQNVNEKNNVCTKTSKLNTIDRISPEFIDMSYSTVLPEIDADTFKEDETSSESTITANEDDLQFESNKERLLVSVTKDTKWNDNDANDVSNIRTQSSETFAIELEAIDIKEEPVSNNFFDENNIEESPMERRRRLNREKQQRWRDRQSPETLQRLRRENAGRRAKYRQHETPEQAQVRRVADARCKANRRKHETPEQAQARRARHAQYRANRRKQEARDNDKNNGHETTLYEQTSLVGVAVHEANCCNKGRNEG